MSVLFSSGAAIWPATTPQHGSAALSFWAYVTYTGALQIPIGWYHSGSAFIVGAWFNLSSSSKWLISTSNTGGNVTTETPIHRINQWAHIFALWSYNGSTTDMVIYLNGDVATRGAAAGKANMPGTIDNFTIGLANRAASQFPLINGLIAEVGVWEGLTGFTYRDIEALRNGARPWRLYPDKMTRYIPLRGSFNCEIQGAPSAVAGGALLREEPPPEQYEHAQRPESILLPGPFLHERRFWPAAAAGVSLTVASMQHSQSIAAPTLTQDHQVTAAGIAHAHAVAGATVTPVPSLSAADASHAQTVAAPAVSQDHQIETADHAHGHAVSAPAVSQDHQITAADAAHAHSVGATVVTLTAGIAPADAAHGHAVAVPSVAQVHTLSVGDAAHDHAIEQASIAITAALSVAGLAHGHAIQATTITPTHALAIADLLHAIGLSAPTITQTHVIIADSALHAQLVTVAPLSGGVVTITTPPGNAVIISGDPVVVVVRADPNTVTMQ